MLFTVQAAGVIDDAPTFALVLNKVADFLLSVFGIVAILCLVVAGFLYLTAGDDRNRIWAAKQAFIGAVIGTCVALGSLVIIRQIASFF